MGNIDDKIEFVSFHDHLTVEDNFCTVERIFRVIYADRYVLEHPTAFFLNIQYVEADRITDITPPFSILRSPYSLN